MSNRLNILGISGSLRMQSFNTASLRVARDIAPSDVSIEIADLSQIPLYDQDQRDKSVPTAVTELVAQVAEAGDEDEFIPLP